MRGDSTLAERRQLRKEVVNIIRKQNGDYYKVFSVLYDTGDLRKYQHQLEVLKRRRVVELDFSDPSNPHYTVSSNYKHFDYLRS